MAQMFQILEDGCKESVKDDESVEPTLSGKSKASRKAAAAIAEASELDCIRSMLALSLGETLGGCMGEIGSLVDKLLLQLTKNPPRQNNEATDKMLDTVATNDAQLRHQHPSTQSLARSLRVALNFCLIFLSSLQSQRRSRVNKYLDKFKAGAVEKDDPIEDDFDFVDYSVLLELRPETIQSKAELYSRLCRVAQKIDSFDAMELIRSFETKKTQQGNAQLSSISTRNEPPSPSERRSDYENRPIIHGLIELLALVLSIGYDGETSLLQSTLFDSDLEFDVLDSKGLPPTAQLRIPVAVKSHLAFQKRGASQDWITDCVVALSRLVERVDCDSDDVQLAFDAKSDDERKQLSKSSFLDVQWDDGVDWVERIITDVGLTLEMLPLLSRSAARSKDSLWVLAARLFVLTADLYPAALRQCISVERSFWLNHKMLVLVEHITRSVVTPRLLSTEIERVKRSLVDPLPDQLSTDDVFDDETREKGLMFVQYDRHLRQLRCRLVAYPGNELSMQASLEFHDTYPLRCPDIQLATATGVPTGKAERWIFSSKQILLGGQEAVLSKPTANNSEAKGATKQKPAGDGWDSDDVTQQANEGEADAKRRQQNFAVFRSLNSGGSVTSALLLLKSNVNEFFSGVEKCSICYCVVHSRSRALANQKCVVCKYKFHSECLEVRMCLCMS